MLPLLDVEVAGSRIRRSRATCCDHGRRTTGQGLRPIGKGYPREEPLNARAFVRDTLFMKGLHELGHANRDTGLLAEDLVYSCLLKLRADGIDYAHKIPDERDRIHCDFIAWFTGNQYPFNVQVKSLLSPTSTVAIKTEHIRCWVSGHLPVVIVAPIGADRFLWADPIAKVLAKGGFQSLGSTVSFDRYRDFQRLNINNKLDRLKFVTALRLLGSIWPSLRESANGRAALNASSKLRFNEVVDDPRLLSCVGTCSELTTWLMKAPRQESIIVRPFEVTRELCSQAFSTSVSDLEQIARLVLGKLGILPSKEMVRETGDWLAVARSHVSGTRREHATSYNEMFAILAHCDSFPGRHVASQARATLAILRMMPENRVYDSLEHILARSTRFSTLVRASYYLRLWGQQDLPDVARFAERQRVRLGRCFAPNSYETGIINLQFLYAEALLGSGRSAEHLTALTKDPKYRHYTIRFNLNYYDDVTSAEIESRRHRDAGASLDSYSQWYRSVMTTDLVPLIKAKW